MDLKLSEKHQETPPKPPPSPETTELPNAVSSTSPLISTKEKRTNATMLQRVQKHKVSQIHSTYLPTLKARLKLPVKFR